MQGNTRLGIQWVESNLPRQPVSRFLSLGCVVLGKAILPPKTREYRLGKHHMFISREEQAR
jgi:hypothetical protein